jgi:maltooligosyltrehalose synthase
MELNLATMTAVIGMIGGLLSIINQLSSLRKQQADAAKAQAVRDTKLDEKLKTIDERLAEHNSYAEKFASLTNTIVEMRTDIKWIKEQK